VLGPRGKTWLRAGFWLLIIVTTLWPVAGNAANSAVFASKMWPAPFAFVTAQSPMEAQMLGERPVPAPPLTSQSYLRDICSGLQSGQFGTTLTLPKNFRISFRYNSENPVSGADRISQPPLLFKYSMDYCFTAKLRVGLSGFLYQPPADNLSFLRQKNDLALGWGPSLKYDLGRFGFTIQSQVERGRPEDNKDLQSWFRVWYVF